MPKIPINEKAAPTSFGLISFDKVDLERKGGVKKMEQHLVPVGPKDQKQKRTREV